MAKRKVSAQDKVRGRLALMALRNHAAPASRSAKMALHERRCLRANHQILRGKPQQVLRDKAAHRNRVFGYCATAHEMDLLRQIHAMVG